MRASTALFALHRPGARAGWLALCAAWAISAPAQAYVDHFLSGTLVGTLNQAQTSTLVSTFRTTLSEAGDGASVPLKLPAGEGGKTTEGELTPIKTTIVNGERCRQIRTELRQGGKSERWTGWYCQQPNGDWRKSDIRN